eukprot:TRINITY_DN14074_c0_g2_i4.p1 TRINITY_DN14074_c0_g2~~TRINITY_DN14074_c0_g2_i4.p1  ORF type:complete len:555 (+),score=88.55 TRINITY_DN14074_c0_g2_i4:85-1749(+)
MIANHIKSALLKSYDYVIVGGGSAGCLLANRLSSDPRHTVALLEAGPETKRSPLINLPVGFFYVVPYSTTYNYQYTTVPQKHLNNRSLLHPRGRGLGGSSAINAMVFIRGSSYDYDQKWVKQAGCEGWEWNTVLSTFKKLESNDTLGGDYHGRDGQVKVRTPTSRSQLAQSVVKGGMECGIPYNSDFNGESQEGIGFYQFTQTPNRRCSSAAAFLSDDVRSRPNLHILTDCRATKLISEKKRIVGVECYHSGKTSESHRLVVKVDRDAILSGGSFNSPQLLLLSGIGPVSELTKHGIPVVHESPGVGQNLQDHLDCIVTARTHTIDNPLQLSFRSLFQVGPHLKELVQTKSGVYAGDNSMVGTFLKSDTNLPCCDIQMHICPLGYGNHGKKLFVGGAISLLVCNLVPKSKGRVGLVSANPFDNPEIDPNYLSDESDFDPMIFGIRKAYEILGSRALSSYAFKDHSYGHPNELTDERIKTLIRGEAETLYHPTSTCRMGPETNPMNVVDHRSMKVYGMEGLRVVDASVMPCVIGGNTNVPTMVVAELAAEKILKE